MTDTDAYKQPAPEGVIGFGHNPGMLSGMSAFALFFFSFITHKFFR